MGIISISKCVLEVVLEVTVKNVLKLLKTKAGSMDIYAGASRIAPGGAVGSLK